MKTKKRLIKHLENVLSLESNTNDSENKMQKWFFDCDIFYQKYVIQAIYGVMTNVTWKEQFMTFFSPTDFINVEYEPRCDFNSTMQVQNFNNIFRKLILNI